MEHNPDKDHKLKEEKKEDSLPGQSPEKKPVSRIKWFAAIGIILLCGGGVYLIYAKVISREELPEIIKAPKAVDQPRAMDKEKVEGAREVSPVIQKESTQENTRIKSYTVEGVLCSKDNPAVIINGLTYTIGDSVGGGKITGVSKGIVTIKFKEGTKTFKVGDIVK